MKLKDKKAKRDRAAHHNIAQSSRRKEALAEAQYAAEYLNSKGETLKEKRTGKKLTTALVREMQERGYKLVKVSTRVVNRRTKGPKIGEVVWLNKWIRLSWREENAR
jgi:hypothetical protein